MEPWLRGTNLDKYPLVVRLCRRGEVVSLEQPNPRLDPVAKAKANPKSRRLAIAAKCWDCQGGDADPGVIRRIRECGVTRCPLHHVRPYQAAA